MATLNQLEEAISIAAYVAQFGAPLTVPPNYSGDASASTEIIPIWLKNSFKRDSFPGHASIETEMHTMKKAGDALEKDIGEAIAWIQNQEKEIIKDITNYIHHQLTAMTAGQNQPTRAGKACQDVITFVKQVTQFVKDLQQIVTDLMDIIRYLISVIQRLQAFLQQILNAIATLINQICNFHLPALPSIPNLFGGLHFDGFKFTKGMFKFQLTFDTQFAFGNCQIRNLGLNPFATILQNFQNAAPITANPNGSIGAAMTSTYSAYFVPPLGGVILPVLSSPLPSFNPSFNPLTDFTGALPAPSSIVSAFQLTPTAPQVLSLVGAPILDENPAGVVGGSTISIYPATTIPYSQYLAPTRAFAQAHVTLAAIVSASTSTAAPLGFDPTRFNPGGDQTGTPTWALCWSWLLAMNQCRGTIPVSSASPNVAATPVTVPGGPAATGQVSGRGGAPWLPELQAVFAAFVDASSTGPCHADLNRAMPWNAGTVAVTAAAAWAANPVGTPPEAITPVAGAQASGPATMAFFQTLQVMAPTTRGQVLWMLSYLEAALLGYPRSAAWDAYAPGGASAPATPHPLAVGFGTGPTGFDLDYQQLPAPALQPTSQITLDSGGRANYPSVITVPTYLLPVVTQVVGWAEASILNTPAYASANLRNMYVYTAQATAILINSYSQFWRDFAANWETLQGQPAALQAMVYNYPLILASALNPRSGSNAVTALGAATCQGQGVPNNPNDPYSLLVTDFHGRTGRTVASGFLYSYLDPNAAALTSPTTQWTPGWPWMAPAVLPQVLIPATDASVPQAGVYGSPTYVASPNPLAPDGWTRADLDGVPVLAAFSPADYYLRPDIMALPYTEQQALCSLNQAFDDVLNTGAQLLQDNQNSINSCLASIADANAQIANFQSMATGPLLDLDGNPFWMDSRGTAMVTSTGLACTGTSSSTSFTSATYTPLPPFSKIPVLTPPTDASGASNLSLPGTPATPNPPATSSGGLDLSGAATPVASMYVDPAAMPTPSDLPPLPVPGVAVDAPTPVAALPSLLSYRQQLLVTVPTPIVVATQPSNVTVALGAPAHFSVIATAPSPSAALTYQWQLQMVNGSGVPTFVNIAGATSASYTTPVTTAAMNESVYCCVVSSTFGSPVATNPVTLTLT